MSSNVLFIQCYIDFNVTILARAIGLVIDVLSSG